MFDLTPRRRYLRGSRKHFELRTAFRRKILVEAGENSEEGCDGRSERTPKKAGTGMLVAFEETCLV